MLLNTQQVLLVPKNHKNQVILPTLYSEFVLIITTQNIQLYILH